jgi:tetratricopeptide (TPR) repeat protein
VATFLDLSFASWRLCVLAVSGAAKKVGAGTGPLPECNSLLGGDREVCLSYNRSMRQKLIQILGLVVTVVYALAIVWLYATEPRSFKEVATGALVAAGTYQVDQQKFQAALALFRREQFRAARDEWQRADPAQSDPTTQFYIAYSFYRQGWGRVYYDQDLFKQGLEAVNRAIALAPAPLTVSDENLQLRTAAELKAELEQGTERSWGDVNPLKVLRQRK